jgi:transposase
VLDTVLNVLPPIWQEAEKLSRKGYNSQEISSALVCSRKQIDRWLKQVDIWREALKLRLNGYSSREIGRKLGTSKRTIERLLAQARELLAGFL